MRSGTLVIVAALGALLACEGAGRTPLGPHAAVAADMKDVERARQLVEQAEAPFKRAADTALDNNERRKARQDCHALLKEARDLYNAYLDEHRSEEDAFDGEYSRLAMMLHFIKKQAGIWDFEPRRGYAPPPPKESGSGTADDGGAGKEGAGDGGGIGGSKRDGESGDSGKGEAGGKSGGDDTPVESGPSKTPDAPDPALEARAAYESILEYQRQFPGDIAGLNDMCLRFLADHDDTSLPEYEKVALLGGALADKLNAFYKATTQQDPDAIEGGDGKDVDRIVRRLSKDLDRGPVEQRVRAARLLGETRSGAASIHLVDALKDDEDALRTEAASALVKIGGSRTGEILISTFRNSTRDRDQMAALQVLIDISKKSRVDADGAVVPIGRFVLSQKESIAGAALDYLSTLGDVGGPGLVEALETRVTQKKLEIIEKLGTSGYYPAATKLCEYLVKTKDPKVTQYKEASKLALTKMGLCAVPYMIPMLSSSSRLWTAAMLRDITGQSFSTSRPRDWAEWYEANKPAGGCGGYER